MHEAGYIGLPTFVRGNNGIEKILNFIEQVGRAKNAKMAVQQLLESELATEFLNAVTKEGTKRGINADFIDTTPKPYIDEIKGNVRLLENPAGELATLMGLDGADEAIIREAQALMRSGHGTIDDVMLDNLEKHQLPPRFDFSERNVATNDEFAEMGRRIINRGAKWKGRLLSDIRGGSSFTITHSFFDALNKREERIRETYEINDPWRRGFEIAIGLCEGTSVEDSEQAKVKVSLVGHAQKGF